MRPCATTPFPSRKRSGSAPRYVTGMLLAVSVTVKRTVSPSGWRATLPFSTIPPMRNVRSFGASWAATCDGVKKKTRFCWNAVRISPAATAIAASPPAISAMRLWRGFTWRSRGGAASPPAPRDGIERGAPAQPQHHDLQDDQGEGHGVRAPDVEAVASHHPEV